jgi:hypothetical protein
MGQRKGLENVQGSNESCTVREQDSERSLINKNNKRKWWSRGTSVDLDRFAREGKCRWVVEEDKKITMR